MPSDSRIGQHSNTGSWGPEGLLCDYSFIREWSLIIGRGATKREGGGQVNFFPYKGGRKNVEGGHNTGAQTFSHNDLGGGAKSFHPLKGGSKSLPCLEGGTTSFGPVIFPFCTPSPSP